MTVTLRWFVFFLPQVPIKFTSLKNKNTSTGGSISYLPSLPAMDGPQRKATVTRVTVLFVRQRVKFSNFMKVQPYNFGGCHRIILETSRCALKNQNLLLELNKKPKNRKILSKSTKKPKRSLEINQKT